MCNIYIAIQPLYVTVLSNCLLVSGVGMTTTEDPCTIHNFMVHMDRCMKPLSKVTNATLVGQFSHDTQQEHCK